MIGEHKAIRYVIRGYDGARQAYVIYKLCGVTPVCSYNGYIRGNTVTLYPRAVFEYGERPYKLTISVFELTRELRENAEIYKR